MPLTFPHPLKKGDTIGIVSPASSGDAAILDKGRLFLEKHGYRVVMHPQNFRHSGSLAGNDEERAAALMDMFADPAIDAIMCARGGNGAIRIIDALDYRIIKKHPKIFIGYSDITALLQAMTKKCGFATYHGPMLSSFGRDFDPRTATDFFAMLENKRASAKLLVPDAETLVPGRAVGTLVGGNLTMLQNLVATPYDWTGKKSILFIEDINEALYRIDRILAHLRLAGKFAGLQAVIVGEMIDMPDAETNRMRKGERPYGRSFRQILQDNLPPDIPICLNFPCGHGAYITTLPVGARVALTVGKKGTRLEIMRS